jgi:hypothetical protein
MLCGGGVGITWDPTALCCSRTLGLEDREIKLAGRSGPGLWI